MPIRPADRLALAALVGAVPVRAIDDVVRDCGHDAERVRTLPPWVTAYHVLAAAMSPAATYDEVTELLWSTLAEVTGRGLARRPPSAGAITRARVRLGCAPLALLLERLVSAARPDDATNGIYLQRVHIPPSSSLWWICAAAGGGLRGCDLRGEDIDAAVDLVERSQASRVVVCPPSGVEGGELLARLGKAAAERQIEVGELPSGYHAPWTRFRGRTPLAWDQEALAQAVIAVALEAALADASSQG